MFNSKRDIILRSDVGDQKDPNKLWGMLEATNPNQYEIIPTGGDPRPQADGTPQGNDSFMRLTVNDGDNPHGYGERCELGYNSWKNPIGFYLFEQGHRRQIYESIRFPYDFPLAQPDWQVISQIKPCGPYQDDRYHSPVIALEAKNNRFNLVLFGSSPIWSMPARVGVWYRISWDIRFSQHADDGWIDLTIDDGDTVVNSGTIHCPTLHTQTAISYYGTEPVIFPGDPVPCTLRAGIYHHPGIPGTYVDLDNIQVARRKRRFPFR